MSNQKNKSLRSYIFNNDSKKKSSFLNNKSNIFNHLSKKSNNNLFYINTNTEIHEKKYDTINLLTKTNLKNDVKNSIKRHLPNISAYLSMCKNLPNKNNNHKKNNSFNFNSTFSSYVNKTENNLTMKTTKTKLFFGSPISSKHNNMNMTQYKQHYHTQKNLRKNLQNCIKPKNINKYEDINDFSLVIKKLDRWDQDHLLISKDDLVSLYRKLNDYYSKNNLPDEQKNLNISKNMVKSKSLFKKLINYGYRKCNKNLFNFYEQCLNDKNIPVIKNGDKTPDYNKKIKQEGDYTTRIINDFFLDGKNNLNLKINLETKIYNNIKGVDEKNDLFKNLSKDTIKYENELRNQLMFINKMIYDKKLLKQQYIDKLDNLLQEKNRIKVKYEDTIATHLKSYWKNYDEYSQHFKKLIEYLTPEIPKNYYNNQNINNNNLDKNLEFNTVDNDGFIVSRSINRKKTINEISLSAEKSKQMKKLESFKFKKLYSLSKKVKMKIEKSQKDFQQKQLELINEKKDYDNEIKIKNYELEYYKKINDELITEHRDYYMKLLKQGQDFRNEGLVWIVKNLLELQVNLEYHHFPKYLTHEQIDFLKKMAMNSLEKNQLKIVINVIRNKKNAERFNEKLKCLNLFENMMRTQSTKFYSKDDSFLSQEKQNKRKSSDIDLDLNLNKDGINNEEFLNVKKTIDKKFDKIYQKNEEAVRLYLGQNVEELKMKSFIEQLKKGIYMNFTYGKNMETIDKNNGETGHRNFLNRETVNLLESFIGSEENKDYFNLLLNIKKRLNQLDIERENLIKNEKEYFAESVKNVGGHLPLLKNVFLKEMIKEALFGAKI